MTILETLRQYTINDYAIFDLIISFGGMAIGAQSFSKFFRKFNIYIPQKNWIFLTIPIGIIFHIVFKQNTPMTIDFLNTKGDYLIKVIIVVLTLIGLRGIKKK